MATFSENRLVNIPIPWLWGNATVLKSNHKTTAGVHKSLKNKITTIMTKIRAYKIELRKNNFRFSIVHLQYNYW